MREKIFQLLKLEKPRTAKHVRSRTGDVEMTRSFRGASFYDGPGSFR
jgi:hypothetical protein